MICYRNFLTSGGNLLKALVAALEETANYLRQQQHGLKNRAGGKSAGKTPKQSALFGTVVEPPEIGNEREAIHMYMPRAHEFQQSRAPVCAAQTTLLDSTPG